MRGFVPDFILIKNEENLKHGSFKGFALFADISGFTLLTEEMMKKGRGGAEKVSKILNGAFSSMVEAVHSRNGFISTFAGDAFTAIFRKMNLTNA